MEDQKLLIEGDVVRHRESGRVGVVLWGKPFDEPDRYMALIDRVRWNGSREYFALVEGEIVVFNGTSSD